MKDNENTGLDLFPKEVYVQWTDYGDKARELSLVVDAEKYDAFERENILPGVGERVAIYRLACVAKMTRKVSVYITESEAPNVQ